MNTLLTSLYPQLLNQAGLLLARFPGHALQPADLLHIALERVLRRPPAVELHLEPVLFGLVVRVMQRSLINEHRRATRLRRGGGVNTISLEHAREVPVEVPQDRWDEINEALAGLREESPESADIVELRFFDGIPQCEIGRRMSLSPASVSRRWRVAAARLREALRCPLAQAA
jgi:RNA polymerase sigma factor (sigma-70 family)